MNYGDILRSLIDVDDPVATVWEVLTQIWTSGSEQILQKKHSIQEYYEQCEEQSNNLERVIDKVAFDLYDYLLTETKSRTLLRNKFPSTAEVAVIMDGMSIREALPIKLELEKMRYDVEEFTYDTSGAPSDTESYRMKNFEVKSIDELKRLHKTVGFDSKLISKVEDTNELKPVEKPTLLWCVFPDDLMKSSSLNYESIYDVTRRVLLQIVERLRPEKLIVATDHGYVSDIGTWGVPSSHVKFFQRTFKTDRFKTLDTVDEKALHWIKNLDKDSTYFILDNGYAYVRGRYMWTTKGRRPVSFHGGISLTEVLTPLLIVSK